MFTISYPSMRFIPQTHHILNPYIWSSPSHESRVSSHVNTVFLWSQTTHSFHMPRSYSTLHTQIHKSCQAYITSHYIHISHYPIHFQTNTNHPGTTKHPNSTLPRPAPHSGLKGLAQARRARSGESLFA